MLAVGYICLGTPERLRPFAMWTAFPSSDYYGRSDAFNRHRLTARLGIRLEASHVHQDGLCEVT